MTERVVQRGGFGQLFGGKKQKEEEEEEEDSAPQNPLAGLFGGAKKAKVCCSCSLMLIGHLFQESAMVRCKQQCHFPIHHDLLCNLL